MKGILCCALLVACGGNGGGGDDDMPNPDATNPGPDAAVIPEGFTRLVGRTWSLPAPTGSASDQYRCVRFTPTEDIYVTAIQAQAPAGTHHTVLSFAGSNGTSGADGNDDGCNFTEIGMDMIYASGTNEGLLEFPTDVGLKLSAGQQLHLNLHLFNATDDVLSGETAILVKAQPTPPPMLAEFVFAGKFLFTIPANPAPFTVSGGCTSDKAYSIFAVWPHQHQLGTHQKVSVVRGGQTTVLHDGAYDFQEQNYYLQSPMFNVQVGDQIKVDCTWENTTGSVVRFGESSTQEMCFSGLYRFPAQNDGRFHCSDVPQG